jgi:exosortase
MTGTDVVRQGHPAAPYLSLLRNYWFLIVAAAVFAVPGMNALMSTVWTTEQGAQGPIILATGTWLLLREAAPLLSQQTATHARGKPALVLAWLILSFAAYLIAGIINIVWLQWASTYSALLAILYYEIGPARFARLWFPLVYLGFLIPPPYGVMLSLTRSLKLWVSSAAVDIMSLFGFQVGSTGTTLYIDQYELLVAAACSGMNSIVSLLAIGLFYIYLRHRSNWRYALALAMLVIPIAIAANLIRVIMLLLITKYLGNDVAQGMLHEAAGLSMFVFALVLLIVVDGLLDPVRRKLGWDDRA